MNIVLRLLVIFCFQYCALLADNTTAFTFTFTDQAGLPSNSATVTSFIAQYENQQTQTVDNLNIPFNPGTITLQVPSSTTGVTTYKFDNKIQKLNFKVASNTPTTIPFNPPLENGGSFTLTKDGSSYSTINIKSGSSTPPPATETSASTPSAQSTSTNPTPQPNTTPTTPPTSPTPNSDEKKPEEKETKIEQTLSEITIINKTGQELNLKKINFVCSYTDENGKDKTTKKISSSFSPPQIIKSDISNNTIKISATVKHKYHLAYSGIQSVEFENQTVSIEDKDVAKVARAITITKKDNTLGYQVPTDNTGIPSAPAQIHPSSATGANPAPKSDTKTKDTFIQALHNQGH